MDLHTTSTRLKTQGPSLNDGPTRRRFVAWWVALLALHLFCIAYFVGVAVAYRTLPMTNLAFQLRTYSIGIAETEYSTIAMLHEAIAVLHGVCIVLMLAGSLQARRLAFYPRFRRFTKHASPSSRTSSHSVSSSLSRANSAIFGRQGLLGVESVYFDHLLLARELLETSLQTYQAYRMTQVLPRLWLIRVYVVLLVANCWVVPILHRVYHNNHLRRLMSQICDVVLDLVSSMGISLFIFTVYAPQYTDVRFGFPFNNWYNDEWFVSVYQEFQIMLVVSWMDMGSRLVFAFGVLQCIDCLKDMLDDNGPRRPGRALVTKTTALTVVSKLKPPARVYATTESPSSGDAATTPKPPMRPTGNRVVHFVLHVAAPMLFVVWGFVIVGVHVYAEVQHSNLPCRLPLRPWLNRVPACSLVEIDCTAPQSIDSGGDWTVFDPALTAGLVVRHCPDLHVPPTLQSFTGLTTMKVYNATIASWPAASGLSTTSHARLCALYLIRTNVTNGTLPPGLLRRDFPQTFRSFIASVTNLEALPPDLDSVWPKRMALSIEWANFTSVPDVVLRLSPGMLSLSRTPLASVPAKLFELPTLGNLLLSYTSLQELPHNVTKLGSRLYLVFVEGTNISSFASWMDPFIARSLSYHKGFFNAHGTPFCTERAEIQGGTRTQFSAVDNTTRLASIMDVSTPSRLAYATAAVACVSDFKTLFPLAVEDAVSQKVYP